MPFFKFLRRPNIQQLKSDRDVEGLIKALEYQEDHNIRLAAASALGRIRDARAVEPLISALENHPSVREVAALALGEIGDPRAVRDLITILDDDSWEEGRSTVAKALGKIGDPRATKPLINLLEDNRENVRWYALKSLETITDQSFGEDIAEWKRFVKQMASKGLRHEMLR